MYQTLDELEHVLSHKPKKVFSKFSKFFNELKILWLIFTVLFLWTYLVTNAQLVIDNFTDRFSPTEVHWISEDISNFNSDQLTDEYSSDEVDALIEQYWDIISLQQDIAPSMDHYLQQNIDTNK